MWLLVACTEPLPADTPADSLREDLWAPDVECELTTPRPIVVDDLDRYGDFYGPSFIDLVAIEYELPYAEELFGCPTRSEDDVGTTWSGECESEAWTWSGWWSSSTTRVGEEAWDRISGDAHFIDDYSYEREVAFTGGAVLWSDGADWALEREFAMTLQNYNEELDGEWTVSSEEYVRDGGYYDIVVRTSTAAGDACLVQEETRVEGCDVEDGGGIALIGASTVTLVWDPEVACDGCGRVFLDGVEVGSSCDER